MHQTTETQRILAKLPGSAIPISEALKINISFVRGVLDALHTKRHIHIQSWRRGNEAGNGPWMPVYAQGTEPDAPKPEPLDKAEIMRQMRAKRKENAK